jgi:hypothetical protein
MNVHDSANFDDIIAAYAEYLLALADVPERMRQAARPKVRRFLGDLLSGEVRDCFKRTTNTGTN